MLYLMQRLPKSQRTVQEQMDFLPGQRRSLVRSSGTVAKELLTSRIVRQE